MDDQEDPRRIFEDDPLERGPRVATVGADWIEEGLHQDGVLAQGHRVNEPVVPGRDRGPRQTPMKPLATEAEGEEEQERPWGWCWASPPHASRGSKQALGGMAHLARHPSKSTLWLG